MTRTVKYRKVYDSIFPFQLSRRESGQLAEDFHILLTLASDSIGVKPDDLLLVGKTEKSQPGLLQEANHDPLNLHSLQSTTKVFLDRSEGGLVKDQTFSGFHDDDDDISVLKRLLF